MRWTNDPETREDVIDKAKPFADQALEMARDSGDPDLITEMLDHGANLRRLFPVGTQTYEGMRRVKYASALRILEYTSAKVNND